MTSGNKAKLYSLISNLTAGKGKKRDGLKTSNESRFTGVYEIIGLNIVRCRMLGAVCGSPMLKRHRSRRRRARVLLSAKYLRKPLLTPRGSRRLPETRVATLTNRAMSELGRPRNLSDQFMSSTGLHRGGSESAVVASPGGLP